LQQIIDNHYNLNTSNKALDELDNQISKILNKVRKYVEGLLRVVHFSIQKVKIRAAYLY